MRRPSLLLATADIAGACTLSVTTGRHALYQQWTPAVGAALLTLLLVAAAVREEQHARYSATLVEAFATATRLTQREAVTATLDTLAILQAAVDEACCLTGLRTSDRQHDRADCRVTGTGPATPRS